MKRYGVWVILVSVGLVFTVWRSWPNNQVNATMCDVGQGDGLVFSQGFSQLVVDTGPDNGKMTECLSQMMPFWDREIEVVVITHADGDHAGGLSGLLQAYRVETVATTQAAAAKVAEMVQQRSTIALTWQGQEWYFGDISGKVIWPPWVDGDGTANRPVDDTNRQSLVLRLAVAKQQLSFWLAGDADSFVEDKLLNEGLVLATNILKVGHHGSKTATNDRFLAILQPRQAWISVGKNNQYGHPSGEVVTRLNGLNIPIWRTDEQGTFSERY